MIHHNQTSGLTTTSADDPQLELDRAIIGRERTVRVSFVQLGGRERTYVCSVPVLCPG